MPALSGTPALALISWVRIFRRVLRNHNCESVSACSVSGTSVSDNTGNDKISDDSGGTDAHRLLSALALIELPIELLLVALPGRSYGYYYTTWLPIFALLCGLFAHSLVSEAKRRMVSVRVAWLQVACLCAFLPVMVGVPAVIVCNRAASPTRTAATRVEAARYIAANTSSDDPVLIWGAEPGVNFVAERRAPTRFVYQYPLFTRGYRDSADAPLVKEFLRDLEHNRPALIIDASSSDKITAPIDTSARERWTPILVYDLPPGISEVCEYINSHYELVGSLGPDRWQVYARKSHIKYRARE